MKAQELKSAINAGAFDKIFDTLYGAAQTEEQRGRDGRGAEKHASCAGCAAESGPASRNVRDSDG